MTAAQHDRSTTPDSTFGRLRSTPDWMDVSDWSLRRKMAVALAIPVLLATSFGGLRVSNQLAEASDASDAASQADLLGPAIDLVASSAELSTAESGSDAAAEATDRYETAVEDFRQSAGAEGVTDRQRRLADEAITGSVPLQNLSGEEAMDQLRTVSVPVTALINNVAETSDVIGLLALADVAQGLTALANEVTYLDDEARFSRAAGQEGVVVEQLAGRRAQGDAPVAALRQHVALRIDDINADEPVDELRYVADSRQLYEGLATEVSASAADGFQEATLTARSNALRDAALVLGTLLAALVATLVIARTMINPIQRVRRDVLQVAHRTLPKAVEAIRDGKEPAPSMPMSVDTQEEIGQLARAVDTMQNQALNLASDQARLRSQVSGMFETMSRRSKALVDQQLELIDTLERDEEDPQRLQSLFRLDHLAAQMRRNGESLLIVAGGSARAGGGRRLTLSETVQAAISGVAGYERVEIGHFPDISVVSATAGDVVHVLGELVDNALSYSPPTTAVRVNAARGVDGGTVLEIVDQGLGMSPQDLDQMNHRLSASDELTVDTARRMGLFVAATLARRHDLEIRLRANTDQGTTASVYLPPGVLDDGRRPAQAPSLGRREVETSEVTTDLTETPPWSQRNGVAGEPRPGIEPGDSDQDVRPPLPQRRSAGTVHPDFTHNGHSASDLPSSSDGPPSPGSWSSDTGRGSDDDHRTAQIGSSMNDTPPPADEHSDLPDHDDEGLTVPMVSPEYLDEIAGESTPIFDSVRSTWLDENSRQSQWSPTSADAGWTAAEQAAEPEASEVTTSGLPRRRPGAQLVPGGSHVATDHQASRQPDDVRRRLANLNSGVQRGRDEGSSRFTTRDEENR